MVFIFDEKSKCFTHNTEYDISNVYYDNMTLSSKIYFDKDKRHWEQTSYQFKENGKKVPYRSYEIFTSKSIMANINFFQYNKGVKSLVQTDSGKTEGLWYRGDDWIKALSKDYHIWYKDNLKFFPAESLR